MGATTSDRSERSTVPRTEQTYSIAPQAMTLGGDNDTPAKAACREAGHRRLRLERMPVMLCVILDIAKRVALWMLRDTQSLPRSPEGFRTSGAVINTTEINRPPLEGGIQSKHTISLSVSTK